MRACGRGSMIWDLSAQEVMTNRARADAFAANVLPIARQTEAAGVKTHRAIAAALNARGIRTMRGQIRHDIPMRLASERSSAIA
jgi:hypothetical protein